MVSGLSGVFETLGSWVPDIVEAVRRQDSHRLHQYLSSIIDVRDDLLLLRDPFVNSLTRRYLMCLLESITDLIIDTNAYTAERVDLLLFIKTACMAAS